jgi:hypothetical protein
LKGFLEGVLLGVGDERVEELREEGGAGVGGAEDADAVDVDGEGGVVENLM